MTSGVPAGVPAARSASAPSLAPAVGRAAAGARAVLTVVPRARTASVAAPRLPFAVAVVGLLVAGLIGLLVLNTVLGKDAFRLHELQVQSRELADREQSLTREVEAARSPASLAAKAGALGMVPAGPPAFLRLPDGAVLGSAEPALAPEVPEPLPVPVEGAADEPVPADAETSTGTSTETSTETLTARTPPPRPLPITAAEPEDG